jgi:hypothetical protein
MISKLIVKMIKSSFLMGGTFGRSLGQQAVNKGDRDGGMALLWSGGSLFQVLGVLVEAFQLREKGKIGKCITSFDFALDLLKEVEEKTDFEQINKEIKRIRESTQKMRERILKEALLDREIGLDTFNAVSCDCSEEEEPVDAELVEEASQSCPNPGPTF